MPENDPEVIDPVSAYDRIAPSLASLAKPHKAYFDRIDQLVISEIPRGSQSLLDVGAGDGARARRIAQGAGLSKLTLLEPSKAMRRLWPAEVSGLAIRAEDLSSVAGLFDVIICLWNVLGHVSPSANRTEVLRQFARLLSPGGRIFIDVNHRYNVRQYGVLSTLGRRLYDCMRPSERNGDVTVVWNVAGTRLATRGHVFTGQEVSKIAAAAGLRIERKYIVDYSVGVVCRWAFQGNLLYVLSVPDRVG